MTLKSVAGRLDAAAETDSGLLIALRAAYRGRHDVRDALWWRAHPLCRTPGGRLDPLVGLAALDVEQGAVADAAEGGQRRVDLTRLLAQDAAALDRVLVSFSAWPGFGSHEVDQTAETVDAADADTSTAEELRQPGQPRRTGSWPISSWRRRAAPASR